MKKITTEKSIQANKYPTAGWQRKKAIAISSSVAFRCTLIALFLFTTSAIFGQSTVGCDCTDYIYLNDEGSGSNANPPDGFIHKFAINSATGAASEIGNPWFSPLLSPHGSTSDLNGNLYVGERLGGGPAGVSGNINKISCDGTLIESDFFAPNDDFSFNYFSLNGIMYMSRLNGSLIQAFSLCDGQLIGDMNIGSSSTRNWGLTTDGENWYLPNRTDGVIYKGSTDISLFTSPATNTGSALFSTGLSGDDTVTAPMGITIDGDGNIYQVFNSLPGNDPVVLRKYAQDGTLLVEVTDNNNNGFNTNDGEAGLYGARGIVYSEESGLIYVSNFENCITVFDTDLNEQTALNIGNPLGGSPKGISIITECCPTVNTPVQLDTTVCSIPTNERLFLQEFIGCDGPFCEGTWSEVTNNPNISFDNCDNSIIASGSGCASYSLSSDGTNTNAQCGAFMITLDICFAEPPMATLSTVGATCGVAGIPNDDAQINLTAITGDRLGIIAGADYDVAGGDDYASAIDLGGAATYDFTNLTQNTQYSVRVFNGSGTCVEDYTLTTEAINCAILCVDPTATAFAIQPSCTNGAVDANTGFLQISTTDGDAYHWSLGDTFDDDGGTNTFFNATSLIGASYPLQVAPGQPNPSGTQLYTIRIYNGANDCFLDVVVTMQEQDCTVGCDCEDYLYLNDIATNEVHKFRAVENGPPVEIGSPFVGPTTPGGDQPLRQPHGVAIDNNGFLYVGDVDGFAPIRGGIVKLDCAGNVLSGTSPNDRLIPTVGFNMASVGNNLYIPNPSGPIAIYDVCTGDPSGSIPYDAGGQGWGFALSYDKQCYYRTTGWFETLANRVIKGNIDGSGSETVIYTGTTDGSYQGITQDAAGNLYVVESSSNISGQDTRILKISSDGTLLATSILDDDSTPVAGVAGGYNGTRGIAWSEATNRVYVGSREDCIAAFATEDLTYLPSESIGFVPGSAPKGVGITTECCPTNNNQTVDLVQCVSATSDPIFFNEVFPCERGVICEAQWMPLDDGGISAAVFDDCNQTIMSGIAPGCYSFVRSADGTGQYAECGAFYQRFNLEIIEVPEATITGPTTSICEGDAVTLTATTTAVDIRWQSSTTSAVSGFSDVVPSATTTTLTTGVLSETTYFRLLVSGSSLGTGACQGGACDLESNSVAVIVDAPPVVSIDATPPAVCSTQPITLPTAVAITPTDLEAGAVWTSSTTGTFDGTDTDANAQTGDFLTATTYLPSEADIAAGQVTLTLTTGNPADQSPARGCDPESASVTVTIRRVDCGNFPWGGN